jgi:hypothetical protein
MPLLYGEGDHAFARLLEEIDKKFAERAKLDHLLTTLPVAPQAAFDSLENQHGPTLSSKYQTRASPKYSRMGWRTA